MSRFGTKAENLSRLIGKIQHGKLLPQKSFTVYQWVNEQVDVLDDLFSWDCWGVRPLIVRSSAKAEDSLTESYAGHFVSVAGLVGKKAVIDGVSRVIASFQKPNNLNDQVLVQPMLENIMISGVAFTRNQSNGSHYYVVNYDDSTGKSDSVTGGSTGSLKTYFCAKSRPVVDGEKFSGLLRLLDELEVFFGHDALDVEFVIDSRKTLYLLQVRPLIIPVEPSLKPLEQKRNLDLICQKVSNLSVPHPYLFGSRTILGIMPDWNPAEIVGVRPHPLALSLYKELVTDNIWAYQRSNYGYKNLRSFPLLQVLQGLPYIDVRVSFSSFVPDKITRSFANKLVDYYLDQLELFPHHHDKVEFEIVFSCYTLDLADRISLLHEHGFDELECQDLTNELRNLTNAVINKREGLWKKDIEKVANLKKRYQIISESNLDHVSKIYWLIEDCKRYGTLPFAGLARAAFIAIQLLDSIVSIGIMDKNDRTNFFKSLRTVSSDMVHNFNTLNKDDFLKIYGHLRPGTYEVLSERYDEAPEKYFNWNTSKHGCRSDFEKSKTKFTLTEKQCKLLNKALENHQIDCDASGLLEFIKGAIEGREYAKFVFTKSISEILCLLEDQAFGFGFSKDDVSFMNISAIGQIYSTGGDVQSILKQSIKTGRESYSITAHLTLPPLIFRSKDVYAFELPKNQPNFITLQTVEADVIAGDLSLDELSRLICMIPNADPGFDWIFAHKISGLITMYGGINSHMAIRAAELQVPAVIGAGQALYDKWSQARRLNIDCANQSVTIIA